MLEKRFTLKWAYILSFVLAGTIVRLWFGLASKGWLLAPDQLAWQLILDAMQVTGFSYAAMITYPHEGGSFLVSLVALAVAPLAGALPALSLAALVIDAVCRLLQIWIAGRIFGATAAGGSDCGRCSLCRCSCPGELYALSPFFVKLPLRQFYMYYRHFTFIVPLLVLLMCHGFARFRATQIFAGLWLALCVFSSISYARSAEPAPTVLYLDAGWVLSNKFGERPSMLMAFYDAAPEANKPDLIKGYGFGLASALLRDRTAEDQERGEELLRLIRELPAEHHAGLLDGVRVAFAMGRTPKLDSAFLLEVEKRLTRGN